MAAVVVLWALIALLLLIRVSRQLHAGVSSAQRARSLLSPADLEADRPIAPLLAARRSFAGAHRSLENPLLAPVRLVPIAGRQLRSLISLSAAAEQVAVIGGDAAAQGHTLLVGPHAAGPDRVALLASLSELAGRANHDLQAVDLGPAHGLIGPLAGRRDQLATDLAKVRALLTRAQAGSAAAADLLGGRQYLLLGANNAEMRSGSGMFLTAALVETDGGRFQLRDVQQTADLALPPAAVPISGDLADRWGWLHPNAEWRNLGVAPSFETTASLASRMLTAKTGARADGVMAVDVVALRDILEATGPVAGPAGPLTADNVTAFLLHDQYLVANPLSQARRDAVGAVAGQVLQAVQGERADLVALAAALGKAVEGRHLMLWSADPSVEQAWVTAGASGVLGPDDAMVGIINRGANKLDQFLPVEGRIERKRAGSDTVITIRLTVRNDAPPGEVPYIAGGQDPATGVAEGVYKGILAVNVPGRVTQATIDGSRTYAVIGQEGATNVVGVAFELPRGARRQFIVRFRERGRHGALRLLPSARVPPIAWIDGSANFSGTGPRIVTW